MSLLKPDTKSHVHNSTERTTKAPPNKASTLYVVAMTAVTGVFFGLILWAALVNGVGPPFSP
jgi:hypothetical protein